RLRRHVRGSLLGRLRRRADRPTFGDTAVRDVRRRPRGDADRRRRPRERPDGTLGDHEGGPRPMKLGFLTAPFPETPLMEVADWAASSGFEVLEIACWPVPSGPTRRYAGTSHIDSA